MIQHKSKLFEYDKQLTEKGYASYSTTGINPSGRSKYIKLIKTAFKQEDFDLGIDVDKPWEEIEMQDYFQIEYLFVGKLLENPPNPISNDKVGFNIYQEDKFGKQEFQSQNILNLTVIIDK
ncbi:hypothetical protein SAMN05421739_103212 [Pontibacter chinhatensis]|uniref:Uncharacterized protein n=2 Tax=Pontibacter chinhatensis TaxID=1436961 RepID=A0A1I2TNZ0_9BACT|nr:hypothetical protein SAMN05421739_103212 [Pontibacter chinhatensis]